MKTIIYSIFALALTTATASAAKFYSEIGTSVTDNSCTAISLAVGAKIEKGYGPQVKVSEFSGTSCKDSDTRISLEIRKDFPITKNIILTLHAGPETNTNFDGFNLVGGAGVGYILTSKSFLSATINNSYSDSENSDEYYGGTFTYLF